jgi:hypothetical protein
MEDRPFGTRKMEGTTKNRKEEKDEKTRGKRGDGSEAIFH